MNQVPIKYFKTAGLNINNDYTNKAYLFQIYDVLLAAK